MDGMPQIVLLAGVLMLLYGVAVVVGGRMAASRPLRTHSRLYGVVVGAVGGILVIVGISMFVSGGSRI